MPVTTGIKQLIAEAVAQIDTLSTVDAIAAADDDNVLMVDLRDIRELQREGKIPGAFHAPRGMLEFWVDPDSPYHKEIFAENRKFVFYCASGWRSALATHAVAKMGMDNVAHIGGGFSGWKEAGGPVEAVERK